MGGRMAVELNIGDRVKVVKPFFSEELKGKIGTVVKGCRWGLKRLDITDELMLDEELEIVNRTDWIEEWR